MEIQDFLDVLAKVGPIITQIGIPGLLAVVLYFVDKERRRLQSVIEAMTGRGHEVIANNNHGLEKIGNTMMSVSSSLNSLRDLMLVMITSRGGSPPPIALNSLFPPQKDDDDEEQGGDGGAT